MIGSTDRAREARPLQSAVSSVSCSGGGLQRGEKSVTVELNGSTRIQLARPYWPRDGERVGGDGRSQAPYMERLHVKRNQILGPHVDERTREGRRRARYVPHRCFVLTLVAIFWSDGMTVAELTKDCEDEGSETVGESVAFWVKHGLLETVGPIGLVERHGPIDA